MALTNADRQRLHRERLKAKLAGVAAPAATDLMQRLVTAYRERAVALLRGVDDGRDGQRATAAFLAETVTEDTLLQAVASAGETRLVDIYRRQVEADIVEIRKRPRGKYA